MGWRRSSVLGLLLCLTASIRADVIAPEFPTAPSWAGRGVVARGDYWERVEVLPAANGATPALIVRRSIDSGKTWSERTTLRDLPVDSPFGGGVSAACEADGSLQVFLVRSRVVGEGKKPAVDRFLDLWHTSSSPDRKTWSELKPVFMGYIGSLSNTIVLRSGRIVIPFGNWVSGRESTPPDGSHEVTCLVSDDHGKSFALSDARLTSPVYEGYNGSNYGACEPSVIELRDGRVWMLMRTQAGRLYESISPDGLHWQAATASQFYSSTGPPALIRLPDNRILLVWNNCEMPPRVDGNGVYGGRDALHAAVADPDLDKWQGFREVYLDPTRNLTPPERGDRGTAYPDAIQMEDGRVAVVSGQGGRRALFYVDPDWLLERSRTNRFEDDLNSWSVYKGIGPAHRWWRDRKQGAVLEPHPTIVGAKVLRIRRPENEVADGATWNFPTGRAGRVLLRVRLDPTSRGAVIALTDRFFDPCDERGDSSAAISTRFVPGASPTLIAGEWSDVEIKWDLDDQTCELKVNGTKVADIPLLDDPKNGLSYLRLRASAEDRDEVGLLVESVRADIDTPRSTGHK